MPSALDAGELAGLAAAVAEEAGRLLAAAAADPRIVAAKSSATDLVTEADRASEALIEARLAEARPDDALVGEEGAARPGRSGVTWVVDPLDGTVNYAYGYPAYCVSVAAEDGEGPLAAAVHDPLRRETFVASRGGGAWLAGRRLSVRPAGPLDHALVATGFGYRASDRAEQAAVAATVLPRVRDIRRGGSAALDLCAVAAGRVDAYYERGVQRWDVAGGRLVATEAGAWFGTVSGLPYEPGLTVVCAHPDLVDPMVALLAGAGVDR